MFDGYCNKYKGNNYGITIYHTMKNIEYLFPS